MGKRFFFLLTLLAAFANLAYAIPTSEEVYRNNDLGLVVYKDGMDPSIFWYAPLIRLEQVERKAVSRKTPRPEGTNYFFYFTPYMTREIEEFLAGEIPGLSNRTQLKPLRVNKIRILVPEFNVTSESEQVTDFMYINKPFPIKFSIGLDRLDEFESFLASKPGVQATAIFFYASERMDKWLVAELNCKEVYDALNIAASGKYDFLKGDIEFAISNFFEQKYATVRSKGDLPIPEAVSKAISECFSVRTLKKPSNIDTLSSAEASSGPTIPDIIFFLKSTRERDLRSSSDKNLKDPLNQVVVKSPVEDDEPVDDEGRPSSSPKKSSVEKEVKFVFKKELASSTRSIFFKNEHYIDDKEAVAVPFYISSATTSDSRVSIKPLLEKRFTVVDTFSNSHPMNTGLFAESNTQLVISAGYEMQGKSAYNDYKLQSYAWDPSWPSADEDLLYRVGSTGEWKKVNGRAIVNVNTLAAGEIQFYVNKERIWGKLPKDFREVSWYEWVLGMPPIFEYGNFRPLFKVTISGRKIDLTDN